MIADKNVDRPGLALALPGRPDADGTTGGVAGHDIEIRGIADTIFGDDELDADIEIPAMQVTGEAVGFDVFSEIACEHVKDPLV